jgi:hypothetical protein
MTNAGVIRAFLDVSVAVEREGDGVYRWSRDDGDDVGGVGATRERT